MLLNQNTQLQVVERRYNYLANDSSGMGPVSVKGKLVISQPDREMSGTRNEQGRKIPGRGSPPHTPFFIITHFLKTALLFLSLVIPLNHSQGPNPMTNYFLIGLTS